MPGIDHLYIQALPDYFTLGLAKVLDQHNKLCPHISNCLHSTVQQPGASLATVEVSLFHGPLAKRGCD